MLTPSARKSNHDLQRLSGGVSVKEVSEKGGTCNTLTSLVVFTFTPELIFS